LKSALIYKKETTRPLTEYQKRINEEAGKLALVHPELLTRQRGLLERARDMVVEAAMHLNKGKSRSRNLAALNPLRNLLG